MSSLYSDTVQSILDTISDLRGESTTNTDAKRIRAISRSEINIAKQIDSKIFYLPDQTITSTGVASYAIGSVVYPLRNKGLVEVFVDGTLESNRYTVIDPESFKQLYNENNASQLAYVTYDPSTDNWTLTLSPTPEVGKVITYSYSWIPPKRTLTTDSVFCLDMEALARTALAEIYDSEDEDDKAAIERNKAQQRLGTEQDTEDAPSYPQTYTAGGNDHGYGTY